MYIATIDCGTTNSRVYIVNEHAEILAKAAKKVGVRDTAISGSKEALKTGLKEIFQQALSDADLNLNQIELAVSSGMITSEIGLIEIPHRWAPTDATDLSKNLKRVHDTSVFPVDIPIYFVPGIKNRFNPDTVSLEDANALDFMRGEEVQVMGLLSSYEIDLPVTMVVLSSHTKFIPIDQNHHVLGCITTLSGQILEAITKETFVGKSISPDNDFDDTDYLDERIIDAAYETIMSGGFLRSLMIPRFLDVLVNTGWHERKLFVEAAIATEDLRALDRFDALKFQKEAQYVLCGPKKRCSMFKYLLNKASNTTKEIITISDTEKIDMLSIKGSVYLAKQANLI